MPVLVGISVVHGDPVYKSIDADGHVSYGDQASSTAYQVEEVPIEPGPSIDQVLEAKLVGARIAEEADRLEAERLEQERIVDEAKALEEARIAREKSQAKVAAAAENAKARAKRPKNPPPSSKARPPRPRPSVNPMINMRPNGPLLNLPGPPES
jgi:hypothetical protein